MAQRCDWDGGGSGKVDDGKRIDSRQAHGRSEDDLWHDVTQVFRELRSHLCYIVSLGNMSTHVVKRVLDGLLCGDRV